MTPPVGNREGRSASAALSLLLRITLAALLSASLALLACGGATPRPTAPGATAPAAIPPTPIPSNTPAPTPTPAATPTKPSPTATPLPTHTPTPAPTAAADPPGVGEPSVWDELHFSSNPADYSDSHLWEIFQAVRGENVSLFFGDGTGSEWTAVEIAQVNRLLVEECRNTAEEMQAARQVFVDAYGSATAYHEQRSVEFRGRKSVV